MRTVLEKDDKAEGKKNKQNQPKEATDQAHGLEANVARASGQRILLGRKSPI